MNKQSKNKAVAIFEGKQIRRHWDEEGELWYFSVSDVIAVLTKSVDAGAYWRKLKQRLKEEGSEIVTKCHELKFMAKDGKYYASDVADTEVMLRLIQSVPSPNAEPFKLWLARVGYKPHFRQNAAPRAAFSWCVGTTVAVGISKPRFAQMRGRMKKMVTMPLGSPDGVWYIW